MSDLPPPLTPADCDLQDFDSLMVDVRAVLNSRAAMNFSGAEFSAGFALMVESWHQVPAASVPADPKMLAKLSGAGRGWHRVRDAALSEFVLCSDGRYYHPRVAARAIRVWDLKQRTQRKLIRRLEMESGAWALLRSQVFARDDYTCTYCGARGVYIEADHIVPVVLGGPSVLSNLATACRPCNRSKGAKLLSAWRPRKVAHA